MDEMIKTGKKLSAELTYIPFINLALQQNALPVVREVTLANHTDLVLDRLECTFSSSANFIQEKTVTVDLLNSGEELPVHDLGIELNYPLLSTISEAIKGLLSLDIRRDGELLFHRDYELTAFAADQWLGTPYMPELLCSFVTPNLDVISYLQTIISEELKSATGSPSIEGYQGDRHRVYEICSAIYRAIHSWGIHYANPASSFGIPGQRIRFADTIYKFRIGTCLDTSVLFASVMEQCGLHPVILLQEGHAYIGCHLVDHYFPDLPMDNLQTIRKLVDLDEFLVIETTMVTGDATFSEAEAAARTKHLNIDDDFQFAIDVVRARYSGIHPLPLKRSTDGMEFEIPDPDADKLGREQKRDLQESVDLSEMEKTALHTGRIARWTQKLLDLSLRNRLLNVRDTKFVVTIVCPDITVLEDKLAANEAISLNPLENLLGEKDLHDLAMLRNSEIKSDIKQLLDKELQQKRLWTLLKPAEMSRRMTALYRQGKTDLEEGGVNTLFIGLGFLEWKVSPRDEKSYLAPILLIPVRLQRKSIVEGIRVSRLDEDTVINETLLELLRSQFQLNIPGLSPLPADHSGIDVAQVMQIFRQSVKDMAGWEVREEARLGLFSFGKFVMWTDMTARAELLKQNPLVNHLIEGGGIFDDGIEVFPPEEISKHLDLKNLYCPLSADSSQLTAVLYSTLGKNFVLHGPPGTGKSQTITNIIAQNLAMGKRVLFVSEKKAALDVVHKRLTSIGLRPFCLELHSNKSGKSEVLAQFAEALNVPEQQEPGQWEKIIADMQAIRLDLNEYVTSLHKKYKNGMSAYDCFNRILSCPYDGPNDILELVCMNQTAEEREKLAQLVVDLAHAYELTDPASIPFLSSLDCGHEWSPVHEKNLSSAAKNLLAAMQELKQKNLSFCEFTGIPEITDVSAVPHAVLLAERYKTVPDIPEALLTGDFAENIRYLTVFTKTAECLGELRKKLKSYNLDVVRNLDPAGIKERLLRNDQTFFLMRFFKNNALLRELSGLKKLGSEKLTISELSAELPDFSLWIENIQQYESMLPKAKKLLGKYWQEEETDWPRLNTVLESVKCIMEPLHTLLSNDTAAFENSLVHLRTILPHAEENFTQGAPASQLADEFLSAWNQYQDCSQAYSKFSQSFLQIQLISSQIEKLDGILAHIAGLRSMMRYQTYRQRAAECGLAKFAETLENGGFTIADASSVFASAYAQKMLDEILEQDRLFARFSALSHEQKIHKFCELDEQYTLLAKKIVFAKLAAALPRRRSGPCPEGTELGLLKRECEKKIRQKPVRQLLAELPTLAPVLKPCFLMSPLSVAQYLPPDSSTFDLIVFDEASQIPVWDAIGVIARGKQLIVVGDPKQMPPTNFFQKGDPSEDDTETEDLDDMESILDECLAAGVHSSYLNWHYRSRHEALISFSNHYYYEDRLFTFPAAKLTDQLGVKFQFVKNGVYDRRNTRTNRAEAQAMVRYIFDNLEKSDTKKRSIGVVTFSEAQKGLIEDLLEAERSRHSNLESYFSDRNEEPLFVKNLENVQGDERDVILFSICYAPDADGFFSMNFGPLNRQGGERRLNVAITRAKEQIVIFSSVHAHQIELSRTNATGAAHLKYFLDYAEKGVRIQTPSYAAEEQQNLADLIASFLQKNNYAVERNVGCSGYRIDLAVRKPGTENEFLLGIECDGPSYAAQKTIRDRDHLRHDVLQSLGWHICQAWTVDWCFDRKQAEAYLLAAIEKAKTESPDIPAEPLSSAASTEEEEPQPVQRIERGIHYYSAASFRSTLSQEQFYEPETRHVIREQMINVIRQEAPIYERVLKKRIVRAWSFSRTGETIQTVLNDCLPMDFPITEINGERIFWDQTQNPAEYSDYRMNGTDELDKRSIDEIPPEELANAMYDVLVDFNSCEQDTLFRETVKLFGFSTVTQKARKHLETGLQNLKETGRI